ncbi:MAG: MscL family protein, partial [Cellulosilyticaceae bacterium]
PPRTGLDPIVINYGIFLQASLDFLIIAFSIFITLKIIGRMSKRLGLQEEAKKQAPAPSKEEVLLTEIRDLLKQKQ